MYKQVQQQDDLEEDPVMVPRPPSFTVPTTTGTSGPSNNPKKQQIGIDNDDDDDHVAAAAANNPSSCWNITRCAGFVGATAGCFTQGCCLSTLCAVGCIYCAEVEHGVPGDIARACGSMGIRANVMIRECNEEYHLVERSQELGAAAWTRTKEWNKEYRIMESTKNCLVSSTKAGMKFTKDHQLIERTTQGLKNVFSVVAKEIVVDRNAAAKQAEEAFSDPEIYVIEATEVDRDSFNDKDIDYSTGPK